MACVSGAIPSVNNVLYCSFTCSSNEWQIAKCTVQWKTEDNDRYGKKCLFAVKRKDFKTCSLFLEKLLYIVNIFFYFNEFKCLRARFFGLLLNIGGVFWFQVCLAVYLSVSQSETLSVLFPGGIFSLLYTSIDFSYFYIYIFLYLR